MRTLLDCLGISNGDIFSVVVSCSIAGGVVAAAALGVLNGFRVSSIVGARRRHGRIARDLAVRYGSTRRGSASGHVASGLLARAPQVIVGRVTNAWLLEANRPRIPSGFGWQYPWIGHRHTQPGP